MAVLVDPIDFVSLYGADGLGYYVGERDATTNVNARKNAINSAYLKLAQIRGFWRLRSFAYTSSSTPPLADGTSTYAVPTSPAFDAVFRLYFRRSGRYIDVPIVDDEEYLIRSTTLASDKGDPAFARLFQTGTGVTNEQLQLDKNISSNFINQIGTLTLEYFIQVTQLSADTDVPILPANLRTHILPIAAYEYAIGQGDERLIANLSRPLGRMKHSLVDEAYLAVLKHDLTRTGRPRQLRPTATSSVVSSSYKINYGG